jgi:hypothetical protein
MAKRVIGSCSTSLEYPNAEVTLHSPLFRNAAQLITKPINILGAIQEDVQLAIETSRLLGKTIEHRLDRVDEPTSR